MPLVKSLAYGAFSGTHSARREMYYMLHGAPSNVHGALGEMHNAISENHHRIFHGLRKMHGAIRKMPVH